MRQVLGAGALGWPRGMGWGGRGEGGSGWGTHVNPWLIHVSVWQKPLQYCKVISLQLIKINEKKEKKVFSSVQFSQSVVSDSLQHHGLQHARPPCPSPTPRVYSNSCPLNQWFHPAMLSSVVPFSSCLQSVTASRYSLLFQPPGMPKNTGVAYPFSRASSWPRNQSGVSCIAGRFSTSWATREALIITALSCILSTKSVGFCDGTFIVFKVVMLYGESDYGKLCQQLVESIYNIFPGLCSYRPLSLTDGITQSPYASSVPSRLGDHPYPKKFQEADLYCHPCSIPYPTTLQSPQAHSVIIRCMY